MYTNIEFLHGCQKSEIISFIHNFESENKEFIFHTSGSTGKPKKIVFKKDQLLFSAKNTIKYFNLNQHNIFYLCLDIQTVAAKMMIVRAITCGAKLICGPVSKNVKIPELNSPLFIAMVPIQLQNLISRLKNNSDNVTFLIGGASIPTQLYKSIAHLNLKCYQSYGMTETLSHVAIRKIVYPEQTYEALEGITFKCKSNSLIINYPILSKYPIETNDEVDLIDEKHFFWKGRSDFSVNSGGVKLHPVEIEDKIFQNTGLKTILFGLKDNEYGEILVMAILSNNELNISKSKFSFLSSYEIPKKYQFLNEFYYLKSQKIDRNTSISKCQENEWRILL